MGVGRSFSNVEISVPTRSFDALARYDSGGWFIANDRILNLCFNTSQAKRRFRFALGLMSDEKCEVAVQFCNTEEMVAYNSQYRHKQRPTDVLSFPRLQRYGSLLVREDDELLSLGDILVCVPVCQLQARVQRVSLAEEMERVIVHGLVHLRGFDHEISEGAARVQHALERAIRNELVHNFGRPRWVGVK